MCQEWHINLNLVIIFKNRCFHKNDSLAFLFLKPIALISFKTKLQAKQIFFASLITQKI